MENSIVELSGLALALVPVVVALTSIAKTFVENTRWIPLIAICFGILGALIVLPGTFATALLTGVVVGLTSIGAFSGIRATVS